MSDFEMLYIVLMIISIIVSILIAYINNSKKYPPQLQLVRLLFFEYYTIWD